MIHPITVDAVRAEADQGSQEYLLFFWSLKRDIPFAGPL